MFEGTDSRQNLHLKLAVLTINQRCCINGFLSKFKHSLIGKSHHFTMLEGIIRVN